MASENATEWADLTVEHLERLDGESFEALCHDLVRLEAADRHDRFQVDGPAGRYVSDEGRDILLTVRRPPYEKRGDYQRRLHAAPLTEDDLGRTAYSCKTGDWFELAMRDVERARSDAYRPLEVLAEGGRFALLINQPGRLDAKRKRGGVARKPAEHLAAALWEKLKAVDPAAPDPSNRIEVIDADTLVALLRALSPTGATFTRWVNHFGLGRVLHDLGEWSELHGGERMRTGFVPDGGRGVAQDELRAFLRSGLGEVEAPVAVLAGPPGIGKTRLVVEAVASLPALEARVRVAYDREEVIEALDGRLIRRHPDAVLVVDDCPREDVDDLRARFKASARNAPAARMLLIVPASRTFAEGPEASRADGRWSVGPLAADTVERLVRAENAGVDHNALARIVQLSEGYPWSAILLAREWAIVGRGPGSPKEAAGWMLASRNERSEAHALEALRRTRARCLLAASLTPRTDWEAMSDAARESLTRAVGLDASNDLTDVALDCVRRGILRRSRGWQHKYVTPLALEREVVAWLLGPDGTDPGGRRLARHGGPWLEAFHERLASLDLPDAVARSLADTTLADLGAAGGWEEAAEAGLLAAPLAFAAGRAPTETAAVVRACAARWPLAALEGLPHARSLVAAALERAMDAAPAFADAEEALFAVTLVDGSRSVGQAWMRWSNAFRRPTPEGGPTHEARFERLRAHLRSPVAAHRSLALEGLGEVISWPPSPSIAVDAWRMLGERFDDDDPAVAAAARDVSVRCLRQVVRAGGGEIALDVLAAHVAGFPEADGLRLLDALDNVRAFDLRGGGALAAHVERLAALLRPRSFPQRLRHEVGFWGPVSLRDGARDRDLALAREGLAGDAPLAGELDWLLSDEAKRAALFIVAVGSADAEALLFVPLRERATSPSRCAMLANYLVGHVEAGRAPWVEERLASLAGDRRFDVVALRVAPELPPTEHQLRRFEEALEGVPHEPGACAALVGRPQWLATFSEGRFVAFVERVLARGTDAHGALALALLDERVRHLPASLPAVRGILLRALRRLASVSRGSLNDDRWERGALALLDGGDVEEIASLAVEALARPAGSHHHAGPVFQRAAERDAAATWRAVAAFLERGGERARSLLVVGHFLPFTLLGPVAEVLAWVGDDAGRALQVAQLLRASDEARDPLVRALVRRFGAHGAVARSLIGRIRSTARPVASFASHAAQQLAGARRWLADEDPAVRAFGQSLVDALERDREAHSAYEDEARRRWGT